MSVETQPMPGSVVADQRAKLSPELRSICEMIDREMAREFPPPISELTQHYRSGRRDGLRLVQTLIERGQS